MRCDVHHCFTMPPAMPASKTWMFLFVLTAIASQALAESIRLPAIQDNSIVMVDGEWGENAGNSGRLRIKGNQHIVVMSFDMAPVRGKLIKRAELQCYAAADELIAGVTISTIASPWDESRSTGLTSGAESVQGWGYPGARFPAVAGGNGFTLVHHSASELHDGMYRWEIAPDLVQAMAIGMAHGLAIHEHDADYSRNPTIFSREQTGKAAVLVVEVMDSPDTPPEPATELQLVPGDVNSARLLLRAPTHGFAYRVSVNGHQLGQHNVPFVTPGRPQTIFLRDLPPPVTVSPDHRVKVETISRTGEVSKAVETSGKLFPSAVLEFPQIASSQSIESSDKRLVQVEGLAVIPVVDKYDRDGAAIGSLPVNHRTQNRIFRDGRIVMTAAAGEVVGFQLLLRGKDKVAVSLELDGVSWRNDLFEAVYVPAEGRYIPDPLIPLPGELALDERQDTSVIADIYVPFDARAGRYTGQVVVSDGRQLPLEVMVLPVALPRRASFLCEMNSYGLPDHVDDYYALQQVAYDHRVHANILHYSHHTAAAGARKSNLDMRLRSGKRMDNKRYDTIEPGAKQAYWDDFVEAFGAYLDGSYFRDGHRGAIPAPGFYLTFHESWPLNCRPYFNGNPDAYLAFADNQAYASTYVDILQDFAALAERQGWNETGFQVYFNNKGSMNEPTKAPWILDEPSSYWDYRALQFYGELTDRGAASSDVHIDYRVDISRPEYCRGQMDGRDGLWVVSSTAFQNYRRLVSDRMDRDGLKVWIYGTANPVDQSNRQAVAWGVDAWRFGAAGIVPWQTVDKTGQAMRQADQLGLFIFEPSDDGRVAVRHSLRLKAFREAEQLVERLHLIQKQRNWSLDQMQEFIDHYVKLDGRVRQLDDADAGTGEYASGELLGLDSLWLATEAILQE